MNRSREFSKIVILAQPGRKRENLSGLLTSILNIEDVIYLQDALEVSHFQFPQEPLLIFIDHTLELAEMDMAIQDIRKRSSNAFIVLLLSLPQQRKPFSDLKPDLVLPESFSAAELLASLEC